MSVNDHAQNRQDASLSVDRALPTADGNVTSADIVIGTAGFPQAEGFSMGVRLPDLTSTHLPNADTLTVELLNGASATPTTDIATRVVTGDGSTAAAQTVRLGVPRDAGSYFAIKMTAAGGTGDMSALTAVCGPLF